jgi:molybdopterin synthase catalytic subunit
MERQLTLSQDPIDDAGLARRRRSDRETGAVVCFLGLVRGTEGTEAIQALEYEAFINMVEHQFGLIFAEMEKRWPVHSVRVVHRIGRVRVTEASLWVEVLAGHRGEAFAACQYLIDEMKRLVPIWKKPIPAA